MDILDQFRRTAERATLKYAAGQQMFCPKCQRVLDAKRTVLITDVDSTASRTVCVDCFGRGPEYHGRVESPRGLFDVLHGGALWPKRTKGGK